MYITDTPQLPVDRSKLQHYSVTIFIDEHDRSSQKTIYLDEMELDDFLEQLNKPLNGFIKVHKSRLNENSHIFNRHNISYIEAIPLDTQCKVKR